MNSMRHSQPCSYSIPRALLILSLAAFGYVLLLSNNNPAAAENAPSIRVVETTEHEMKSTLPVNGTIIPRQEAAVGVDLNGMKVLELRADIGDMVGEGDILAVLDASALELAVLQAEAQQAQINAQAEQARAQVADAQIGVRQAGETLERIETLRKKGVASQAQFDNAVNALDSARAKLSTAQKSVTAAQAQTAVNNARIQDIRRQIANTNVRAPAPGRVLARNAMLGAVVGASAGPLFRIAIRNEMELQATVSETHLPRLRSGQKVEIHAPGASRPLIGQIRLVGPEVNRMTRLGTLYISVSQNDVLRPGNFASGTIELISKKALALPSGAILYRGGEAYVQKAVDGIVQSTKIVTGIRTGSLVEIVTGLEEGDLVIEKAGVFVSDGENITPVHEQSGERASQ